jgi:hypothetical protein
MKMNMKDNIWEYFESVPDDYLVLLAEMNWEGLEKLCILLTLDKQIQAEAEQNGRSRTLC